MKQSSLGPDLNARRTRKREFLEQRDAVIPWAELVAVIAPYYPQGRTGRPPFALETMLRVHFMQQWFCLSDPAMEEAFFDTPLFGQFAQLPEHGRVPDESTILRFRHRLEKYKLTEELFKTINDLLRQRALMLRAGTLVDATLDCRAQLDQEQGRAARPRDAFEQKGRAVVLRDESAHGGGCGLRAGAYGAWHGR